MASKIQIWLKTLVFLWESEEKWSKKLINEADKEGMETKRVAAMASLDTSVEWLHQTV